MKRNITLAAAFALAFASSVVLAETTTESVAEPSEAPVEAPAVVLAEVAPAPAIEIPADIQSHLDKRFPGSTVYGITREGHTYLVDLGNGQHVRYDNCCNPVCYGDHTHE